MRNPGLLPVSRTWVTLLVAGCSTEPTVPEPSIAAEDAAAASVVTSPGDASVLTVPMDAGLSEVITPNKPSDASSAPPLRDAALETESFPHVSDGGTVVDAHSMGAPSYPWTLTLHDLPAALTSVSGSNSSDVWVTGALLGETALVLHYDGESWTRVDTTAPGDLWWVHSFGSDSLFFGGARGTIIRSDGARFTPLSTPDPNVTIYGLWGSTSSKLWAVGTDGNSGVIWRSNGDRFETAGNVDPALLQGTALFKVWGRNDSDVWFVGDKGLILHFDGESITRSLTPSELPLTTVHGTQDALYAVGGFFAPVILALQNGAWVDATPSEAPNLYGVFSRRDVTYAVGAFGEVFRSGPQGSFLQVNTGLDLAREYHAVWIDDDDGIWAVGGHVTELPLVQGLLSYSGPRPPSQQAPEL